MAFPIGSGDGSMMHSRFGFLVVFHQDPKLRGAGRRTVRGGWARRGLGFTLIELLVVLSIVALLLTIVTPRYMGSIDHAKEVALKEDLKVMRLSIDRFHGDKGRYPESLAELVEARYLRAVPPDPITDSATTWVVVPVDDPEFEGISDVSSGAQGVAKDGSAFAEW